jgi:hypothetical protein
VIYQVDCPTSVLQSSKFTCSCSREKTVIFHFTHDKILFQPCQLSYPEKPIRAGLAAQNPTSFPAFSMGIKLIRIFFLVLSIRVFGSPSFDKYLSRGSPFSGWKLPWSQEARRFFVLRCLPRDAPAASDSNPSLWSSSPTPSLVRPSPPAPPPLPSLVPTSSPSPRLPTTPSSRAVRKDSSHELVCRRLLHFAFLFWGCLLQIYCTLFV